MMKVKINAVTRENAQRLAGISSIRNRENMMTAEEVAEKLGVSLERVDDWETCNAFTPDLYDNHTPLYMESRVTILSKILSKMAERNNVYEDGLVTIGGAPLILGTSYGMAFDMEENMEPVRITDKGDKLFATEELWRVHEEYLTDEVVDKDNKKPRMLSAEEVARILRVDCATVKEWAESGFFHCTYTSENDRVFTDNEVTNFVFSFERKEYKN